MNSTEIDNSNGVFFAESSYSKTLKFGLILAGQILSIPSYLFIIYYVISRRLLRNTLHNHVIFVSLLMNFSLHLPCIRHGVISPSTVATCLLWQYLDDGFWFGDFSLKLWAAIERHILIVHSHLVNNRSKKILFHFAPMAIFTLYWPIFYIYLIFFYPTPDVYDFTVLLCGGPYYCNGIPSWLIWYESLMHCVIPIFLMVLVVAALLVRIYLYKARLCVNNGWRQCRKMTIQLVSIALTYVFTFPYIIVTIVRWSGYPDFGTNVQGPYFYYSNDLPMQSLCEQLFRFFPTKVGPQDAAIALFTTVHLNRTVAM